MNILELRLLTHRLADQKAFYTGNLQLPRLEETDHTITLGAGATRLVFSQAPAGSSPTYHFAFNLPEHKLAGARSWLSPRTDLMTLDGQDEFSFPDWNADAVYFYDPAGNIVELIARHNLPIESPEPFGLRDVLRVSEIGLVVSDVPVAVESLRSALGFEAWNGRSDTFVIVGDEQGLLIILKRGRRWFPTDIAADTYPVTVIAGGVADAQHDLPGSAYHVRLRAVDTQLQ